MKRIFTLFTFITLFYTLNLNAQSCIKAEWVKDFGGNSAYQSIVDGDRRPDGQFVVAGTFTSAPLTLDTITLPALYSYNFYLGIHDSSGHFSAAKVIASGGTMSKIDVGADGSIYVTGYWDGSMILGNDTLPAASRKRVYVAKFDANLNFKWARQSNWMSADCFAYDVTSDLQNNVYICGNFEDNAFKIGDFVTTNSGGWNAWSREAFFIKFDSNGTTQYLKSFGSNADDGARTITADSLGNIFVSAICGKTAKWIKFGDQLGLPGGVADNNGILAKYDANTGDVLWAKMLGGLSTYDQLGPYDACIGDNNSLILCGSINGTVSLPPHTFSVTDQEAFIARFNNNGDNEWLQTAGGQGNYEYAYYCMFHKGKIAVSGRLSSNTSFCANFPLYSTLSNAGFDSFNAMFESNGKLMWARGNDANYFSDYYPGVVLIDDAGNQLFWGSYKFTQTFYPIAKTNLLSNLKTFLVRFVPFSPASTFTVSDGPDKSTTCGVNIQLQASTSPSSMPFGWWPSLGFSANNTKTPNIAPAKPGWYVFYATYQGCVKSDSVFVDVTNYNNFSIDAGPDQLLCAGDSVLITTNSNLSGLTYAWTPAKYLNTTTAQNPWVKPVLPTHYVVTASLGNCKATDTVYINQHQKPYIYLPKQDQYYGLWWRTHLCEGHSLDVNLGIAANTYTVLTPSLCSSINNNLITLHGNYPNADLYVDAISAEGCINKDSVSVIIHNNQAAPQILGNVPNRTACPGDSIQITLWITNSILYDFQFSWYSGWQVDSLDGEGWKDISIWEKQYDMFPYSVGYPNSTYYSRLQIPLIKADMDGFKYRCYIKDYCSAATYSNVSTLSIGPKLTQQPPALKTLCQNATDSISVNSSSVNVTYQWEIQQGAIWVPITTQPGAISANGRFLRFFNPQSVTDSSWVRCGLSGCGATGLVYSNPCLVRVVPYPAVNWQTAYDTVCPGHADSLMVITNSNAFAYNWYANNVAITSNNSQISGYNTNKLKFNPVFASQANIDYKLKISNAQCGFSIYSDTTGFRLISVPAVSWPGNMITTCINATPVTLSGGLPAGGTYSGPGVSGNSFNPAIAGLNGHTLSYVINSATPGCAATALKSIYVYDLPTVSWPGGTVQFCTTNNTYFLSGGTPSFGTYSGPGVTGTTFHPAAAGPGIHTVSFSYYYPTTGCTNTVSRTFIVGATPIVNWPGGTVNLCLSGGDYPLTGGTPANGTYSGIGVTANVFDPLIAGTGTFNLSYTCSDTIGNCSANTSRTFIVGPDPVATWPGGPFNYCIDDPADSLFGGQPNGGNYAGQGVVNNMINPQLAGAGLHTISYTYINPQNNCQAEVTNLVYVDECLKIKDIGLLDVSIAWENDNITIGFPELLSEDTDLAIYNPLGQLLYHEILHKGNKDCIIPLRPGHQSVLLLHLSNKTESSVRKFVY